MSMMGKHFVDAMDRNRMLVPCEEVGRDFNCRIYMREPKFLRQKVQRPNEDGEMEWVIVNHEVSGDWQFVGKGLAPKGLFHSTLKDDRSQISRIGYRMM